MEYPCLEILRTFHFDEEQLGVVLALLARGPTVVPSLITDFQSASQDGSPLARDVVNAYQTADTLLQQVAAAREAKQSAAK